jgi:hypothetical protein
VGDGGHNTVAMAGKTANVQALLESTTRLRNQDSDSRGRNNDRFVATTSI